MLELGVKATFGLNGTPALSNLTVRANNGHNLCSVAYYAAAAFPKLGAETTQRELKCCRGKNKNVTIS
jgi:hypothetical protein